MRKLFILILVFSSTVVFAEVTFEKFCLLWKKNPKALVKASIPTIKALYELSGKKNCKEAFEALKTEHIIDLSGKGLKDLSPLKGLHNITTLIINDNELEHLWGVEHLVWLDELEANNNKIHDISALFYCAQINYIYLKNNNITDISPLKEMSLMEHELEGNPIYDTPGEIAALDFLLNAREHEINYEYAKKDGKINREGLEKAARLKDHMLFRTLLDHPTHKAFLTDEAFLLSSETPLKKIIIANTYGRELFEELLMHYRQVKNFDFKKLPPEHVKVYLDLFSNARKKNIPFLRYFLTEGTMFPHNKKDLEALKRHMLTEMKKQPTLDCLAWKKWIIRWQEQIRKTGIPPSMASGFIN